MLDLQQLDSLPQGNQGQGQLATPLSAANQETTTFHPATRGNGYGISFKLKHDTSSTSFVHSTTLDSESALHGFDPDAPEPARTPSPRRRTRRGSPSPPRGRRDQRELSRSSPSDRSSSPRGRTLARPEPLITPRHRLPRHGYTRRASPPQSPSYQYSERHRSSYSTLDDSIRAPGAAPAPSYLLRSPLLQASDSSSGSGPAYAEPQQATRPTDNSHASSSSSSRHQRRRSSRSSSPSRSRSRSPRRHVTRGAERIKDAQPTRSRSSYHSTDRDRVNKLPRDARSSRDSSPPRRKSTGGISNRNEYGNSRDRSSPSANDERPRRASESFSRWTRRYLSYATLAPAVLRTFTPRFGPGTTSSTSPPTIRDSQCLASYTWLRKMKPPTMITPGFPPFLDAANPDTQLVVDNGTYSVDPNGHRVPLFRLSPPLAAVLDAQKHDRLPGFKFTDIQVVCDTNCLGKLGSVAEHVSNERWNIDLERINNTLFMIRRGDTHRDVDSAADGWAGYGHGFESAMTTQEDAHASYCRVNAYTFGSLRVMVSAEVDAVEHASSDSAPAPAPVSSDWTPTQRVSGHFRIANGGNYTANDSPVELKSQMSSLHRSTEHKHKRRRYVQMMLNRSDTMVVGTHDKGRLLSIDRYTADEVEQASKLGPSEQHLPEWEDGPKKLAMMAEVLRDVYDEMMLHPAETRFTLCYAKGRLQLVCGKQDEGQDIPVAHRELFA